MQLRAEGIQVRHVNAVRDKFGEELEQIIVESKIVLNLGYFGEKAEWKMTRCAFPLANEVLVVSEVLGGEEELRYWSGGIAFTDNLADTLRFYLDEEHGEGRRRTVARVGREKLQGMKYVDVVRDGIKKLVGGKCDTEPEPNTEL